MLGLKIVNVEGTNDASFYSVVVFINTRQIWQGKVGPHNRADDWQTLVEKVINTAWKNPHGAIEKQFTHCPTCNTAIAEIKKRIKKEEKVEQ